MTESKPMSKRLQAIVAERQRAAREIQILIELTRRFSDADARLAQALDEIGAPVTKASPATQAGVIGVSISDLLAQGGR